MKEGSGLRIFFVSCLQLICLVSARFEPVTRFEGVARYLYRYNNKRQGECKNGAYNSNSQLRTMETDYGVG